MFGLCGTGNATGLTALHCDGRVIALVNQRKASSDVFDQRGTELMQPFAGPVRRIAGHPDLEMLDRHRLWQCLGEAGRDPRCPLGPQQTVDRQQYDGRSLAGISDRNIQIDVEPWIGITDRW